MTRLTHAEHIAPHPDADRLIHRDGLPSLIPEDVMDSVKTYRQAVRLCWALRRSRGLTFRGLAERALLVPQHCTDYFNPDDKPRRRDLPAAATFRVEAELGNTAISQFHARNAQLTVLEEMQASRRATA